MRKLILSALAAVMVLAVSAQERRELHILSTNDMHAAIKNMPRLGLVADSLRALYPDLLILSAGDNRSGDPVNDLTVGDVLKIDPFQNSLVEAVVTGKELAEMLISCYEHDKLRFPFVSGFKCDVTIDAATKKITKLVLLDANGKKLNLKKSYRLVANSYAVAVSPTNRKDQGRTLSMSSSEAIMNYLEHQGKVSYQGVKRLNEK